MTVLNTLLKLYKPVQPAVRRDDVLISYSEISPPAALEHLVYCFWQLKTMETLDAPYMYRVVADGCIDIFFDVSKPEDSFVMGFCKKFTEFSLGNTFNYVGIRFFPSILPQLFHVNAKALSNQTTKLSAVDSAFAKHIQEMELEGRSLPEISGHLTIFLRSVAQALTLDLRFYQAIDIILESRGKAEIGVDLHTGLSERQLRRVFNYYVGTTAKSFSKIVRFQYVLNQYQDCSDLSTSEIFHEAGFYDQAHFIKDFKKYYGVTPYDALV